jgi:hypothetical protein
VFGGLAFTATVLYDPDLGFRTSTRDPDYASEMSSGGDAGGDVPSFISSIAITINGVTRNIRSNGYAYL